MKKTCVLLLMLSALAGVASAAPGAMDPLWAQAMSVEWVNYQNPRFFYTADYSTDFSRIQPLEDGSGLRMEKDEEGGASLTLTGGRNSPELDGRARLAARMKELKNVTESGADTYWYRVVTADNDAGRVVHEYACMHEEVWASFTLEYSQDFGAVFVPRIVHMEENLLLPAIEHPIPDFGKR